jgi:nicotinate phosphoribosyltransferase
MVYKLVAREGRDGLLEPVAKASTDKAGVGGRKVAWREHDDEGTATVELVVTGDDEAVREWRPRDASTRSLCVPYVVDGVVQPGTTGSEAVAAATERHAASVAALPRTAERLSSGEPVIPTKVLPAPPVR